MTIELLITMLIWLLIGGLCAVAAWYICDKAGYPQFVRWIVGAIMLIILLFFMLRMIPGLHTP